MADLRVELYGELIGHLVGADWRTFDFLAAPEAIDRYGLGSTALSVAVPMELVQNRGRKRRRQNFFAELLPEGDMLESLARQIGRGTSTSDVIALLTHYGRDVAGALQIYDPEIPGEPKSPALIPMTTASVGDLLNNSQAAPLGNRPLTGKSSLAGVQEKIVLARVGDEWNQVIDGYPSTHIIKPASKVHPTVIFDEEYGARFARTLGLSDFDTWLEDFGGTPGLVIERYDRSSKAPQGRIHQEDMNQALGASKNEKYQEYGGVVSLKRIAHVFATRGDFDSVRSLIRMTTLAVAVGNLDMHAKNVSIIHRPDGSITIAPAYDVVPQSHQDNDGRMALSIDGEYEHSAVTVDRLVAEAESWGYREDARSVVHDTLEVIATMADVETPDPRSYSGLAADIARFTDNLRGGKAVAS